MCFDTEAVIGGERAEIGGEWVVDGGAVVKDMEVEGWWEMAEVDPTVGAIGV